MAPSACPSCGELLRGLESRADGSIVYCQTCGWNVAGAQGFVLTLGRQTGFVLVVIVVFLCIRVAASPNRRNSLEVGIFIVALLALILITFLRRLSRDSRRLAELREHFGDDCRGKTVAQPDSATLANFERLRRLPCPRAVRLNQRSRTARDLTNLIPIALSVWGAHDVLLPDHPISLAAQTPTEARVFGAGIIGLGALLWFLLPLTFEKKNELQLLKNGQVGLARVTGSSARSRFTPGVCYEFTDPQGGVMRGQGPVVSGSVNEGDYIVVLYDPDSRENSVALCATNYEFTNS